MYILRKLKSMQAGFGLLLSICILVNFLDLSRPNVFHFIFYLLVILFILNLLIYIGNNLKKLTQLVKLRPIYKDSFYGVLGLHLSLFAIHAGIAMLFMGNVLDISLGRTLRVEAEPGKYFELPGSMIKLENFYIDYYQDGTPSQYTSQVSITEKYNKSSVYDITVNHPLEVFEHKIYQESYGWILNLEMSNANITQKFKVNQGDEIRFGNKGEIVEVIQYLPNFVPRNTEQSSAGEPAVVYFLHNTKATGIAKLGEKVKISDDDYLTFVDKRAFTVLKIKTSPGLPLVQVGGGLLILGIIPAFVLMNRKSFNAKHDSKEVLTV